MPRICFTLQVRPDRLAEYRERHAAVWPEMLRALRDAGWRDYQLFLRDDGLLVGTVVVDDLPAAQAAVDATEVSAAVRSSTTTVPASSPSSRRKSW